MAIVYQSERMTIHQGDALEVMPHLDQVDAVVTDPPYFKVKGEAWDRAWKNPDLFIQWLGQVVDQFKALIKTNGSLFIFASPAMASRVEEEVRRRFHVLNHLVWVKSAGWHNKAGEDLRGYFPQTERIIFAEHYGQDLRADKDAGYTSACHDLHKRIYSRIGNYIKEERERAGLNRNDVEVGLGYVSKDDPTRGTALCYRWEEGSSLPTAEAYSRLRDLLNTKGSNGPHLRREYEDLRREYEDLRREYEDLRREYQDLRREYEDLRRPFNLEERDPHTDVWNFAPVMDYPGKHPCEKPLDMCWHMVNACTRPDGVVLDPFMGSGQMGLAALKAGRKFVGIDSCEEYIKRAVARLEQEEAQGRLF